jgi:RNA-binding protein Tab2/Atab2
VLQRSESIAAWMNGLEIAYIRADLLSRELMMNTDISTQFIVAPLMDAQKREGEVVYFMLDGGEKSRYL